MLVAQGVRAHVPPATAASSSEANAEGGNEVIAGAKEAKEAMLLLTQASSMSISFRTSWPKQVHARRVFGRGLSGKGRSNLAHGPFFW